jgi:hypothetical protein
MRNKNKKLFNVITSYNADILGNDPDIKFVNLAKQYGGHCIGSGSCIGEDRTLSFSFDLQLMAERFQNDARKLKEKLEEGVLK